jgi:hypothetical protein
MKEGQAQKRKAADEEEEEEYQSINVAPEYDIFRYLIDNLSTSILHFHL